MLLVYYYIKFGLFIMRANDADKNDTILTPLERVEFLYAELLNWYGDAEEKELRAAAKLLIVALDKFATYGGHGWQHLALEYFEILKQDPERFQKIIDSNRGELRDKKPTDPLH